MFIPENIHELLDERIQFCESVLSAKDKIPNSTDKESLIAKFDVELKNFKKLKELLTLIVDPGASNITQIEQEFYTSASEMMNKLINHCKQQLENVSDLLTIHRTLNLIEALNKINQQLSYL